MNIKELEDMYQKVFRGTFKPTLIFGKCPVCNKPFQLTEVIQNCCQHMAEKFKNEKTT